MNSLTLDAFQLLNFFGVEPVRLDADTPWPYNDFSYEIIRGDLVLAFSLFPAYKDVRITLNRNGATVYELSAMCVDDIRYHNEKQRETLEIVLNPRDVLWLAVSPAISIRHASGE